MNVYMWFTNSKHSYIEFLNMGFTLLLILKKKLGHQINFITLKLSLFSIKTFLICPIVKYIYNLVA